MSTMQANAEQVLKLRDKMVKLRAKAASTSFPAEAATYLVKADELHAKVLVLQVEIDAELLKNPSYCSESVDGEHHYCAECCCHGACRDCNEIDPEWTDDSCQFC